MLSHYRPLYLSSKNNYFYVAQYLRLSDTTAQKGRARQNKLKSVVQPWVGNSDKKYIKTNKYNGTDKREKE